MTVAKELKRMCTPVIVDIESETGQLPPLIMATFRKAGNAMPYVVLADPGMTKVYGTFSHTQLKGQDYRTIFRDAKRAISADIKAKTFNTDLGAPKAKADPEAAEEKEVSAPKTEEKADAPVAAKDLIKIDNPEMKNWTSSRGSKIEAKLVGVEDKTTFVLVTSGGQTLRVTGEQLSLASLNAAKELAGLE